jgi:hypothetical protein
MALQELWCNMTVMSSTIPVMEMVSPESDVLGVVMRSARISVMVVSVAGMGY